jgi:hypothetical protein
MNMSVNIHIKSIISLKVVFRTPENKSTLEDLMKNYYIKSTPGSADYLSVLGETDEGFMVRIYRDQDGYEKIIDDFMSKTLFESCMRTGYITEMEEKSAVAIA